MLQDGGPIAASFGYPVEVVYVVVKACLAIGLWGAAVVGYLVGPLGTPARLGCALAAALLALALPWTDAAGFAVATLVIAAHWRLTRAAAGGAR
jgi:TRAP-type uncharacterized transport system fused permease subunit